MATLEDQGSSGQDQAAPALAEPLLYDGQRLDQPTFHALYEQMDDDFKAELIDGVVHLTMTVHSRHGQADASMIGFLLIYSIETPGTIVRSNTTTTLGPRSEVQPDSALLIHPDYGGRTRIDAKTHMIEAAELVVEISDSTLRLDLNAKKRVYQEAGALEYVVFDIPNRKFHWFALEGGQFEPMAIGPDGLYRSKVFPGFWIDEAAFVAEDNPAVMAALRRGLESPEHADFVEQLRLNRANRP
jgi:Uma2 family endonuclease